MPCRRFRIREGENVGRSASWQLQPSWFWQGLPLFTFFISAIPAVRPLPSVNGQKITLEQFNNELAKEQSPLKEMFREDFPGQFMEGMVLRILLLQEAKKQGLSAPVKTYKDNEAAKDALSPEDSLINELVKKRFSTPVTITQDEIKAFYTIYKTKWKGDPLNRWPQ